MLPFYSHTHFPPTHTLLNFLATTSLFPFE